MAELAPLELARRQIEFARSYTHTLIDDLEDDLWFVSPSAAGGATEGEPGPWVTHIAWQVGHLAMAEYMLTLFRIRGREPSDKQIIDKTFMRRFLKGSTPDPDPAQYPSAGEIRQVFESVHELVMRELADFPADELDSPVVEPYAVLPNRLGSLLFCASHEMLHAGQIGLIRRFLGMPPLR